jgi:hypothetical protein
MKINRCQEIIIWLLGLSWGTAAMLFFLRAYEGPGRFLRWDVGMLVFLPILFGLIIFSLRARRKPN